MSNKMFIFVKKIAKYIVKQKDLFFNITKYSYKIKIDFAIFTVEL